MKTFWLWINYEDMDFEIFDCPLTAHSHALTNIPSEGSAELFRIDGPVQGQWQKTLLEGYTDGEKC